LERANDKMLERSNVLPPVGVVYYPARKLQ
jgi:hypothetical protein